MTLPMLIKELSLDYNQAAKEDLIIVDFILIDQLERAKCDLNII
tara:strand:+ start:1478 stop:1609 length:132 start_codon:yes stop_codon:yes gene_type:complete